MVLTISIGVPPEPTRFWNALFDVGHVLLFIAITTALADLFARSQPQLSSRAVVGRTVAVALALAAGTELVQSLEPHRDAAFADLLRDAAGMTIALLLRRGRLPRIGVARRLTAGLLGVAVLTPLGAVAGMYVQRNRAVPVVIPLNGSSWARRLLSFHDAELIPGGCETFGSPGTDPLVRLSVHPGTYPGFFLNEPYPDWRAFHRLVFRAAVEGAQPITLTLRIHDAQHDAERDQRYTDRFNTALTITPGVHRFEIPLDTIRLAPLDREMDLGQIRGIGVFAYKLSLTRQVCLSAFRLE
ncbi:MAG TPA: hypothetical protein VD867_00220 [Burkholderiales bacterium]|nr:hypothetical protein [Burkholderiales bacterium]